MISASLNCEDIAANGKHFNLKPLDGAHQVHWIREPEETPGMEFNTTFTIDICKKLKWTKGLPHEQECPHGTRICGVDFEREISSNTSKFLAARPIAGDYTLRNHRNIEATWTLLRDSKSHKDADREGVRGELHGGRYPFDNRDGTDQMAIIEFVCDKERTGLEGDEKDDRDKDEDDTDDEKLRKRKEGDEADSSKGKSLKFLSYKEEESDKKRVGVLRLEWRTKYACEDASEDAGESSGSWGFFTWFIIILFLATAAYLIFGSWLNYNRYGARGWDLLPHGDTIRDLPYLLKDWARRVVNTVQGPGSRGGYSAV